MPSLIDSEPNEVKLWLDNKLAILVDIRESQELAQARISGALHLPLSKFDPTQIPNESGKRTVLICGHGIRSRQVGDFLLEQGFLDEIYHVVSGIAGWAEAGLPIDAA